MRAEQHDTIPGLVGREAHVGPRQAVLHAGARDVVGVDVDKGHLHGEAVATPSLAVPGIVDLGLVGEAELDGVALVLDLQLAQVEAAGLVHFVGRVCVISRPVVVTGRILERHHSATGRAQRLAATRGASAEQHQGQQGLGSR